MGTSKSFAQLGQKLDLAAANIRASRAGSFRQAERDMLPRFRDQARRAAGGDRKLSHHRSQAALDANFKIIDGTVTTSLFITPRGPWGIRDSTDVGGNTKAHSIKAKSGKALRFEDEGGEIIFRSVVMHRGSSRGEFWGIARTQAVTYIRQRLPEETRAAITAALSGAMYKARA